jgi:hypothetical protein
LQLVHACEDELRATAHERAVIDLLRVDNAAAADASRVIQMMWCQCSRLTRRRTSLRRPLPDLMIARVTMVRMGPHCSISIHAWK